MGKISLPPGFRFHPTDVELIKYYLKRKVLGKKFRFDAIAEVDIYKYAPWDLPDKSYLKTGDLKWYFFCPREKKYSSGTRIKRATDLGYWKTTGKDRAVHYNNEVVGMIKTLVFHRGKAPKGERTDWVMYEYKIEDKELDVRGIAQDGYVLCSIFKKDGPGPRNGAQYGAPFKEEDWDNDYDDDGDDDLNGAEVVSSAGLSALLPINQNSYMVTSSFVPEGTCMGSAPYETLPSASNSNTMVADNYVASAEPLQDANDDGDVLAMLANFYDENPVGGNGTDEQVDNIILGGDVFGNPHSEGIDIYNDLGDLGNLVGFGEHEDNISSLHNTNCSIDQMLDSDNMQFLELKDFEAPLNASAEAGGRERFQTGGSFVDSNCYFSPEEFYCDANPYDSVGCIPGCSQMPLLPTGANGFEEQMNVFRKEGFLPSANLGCIDYEAEVFNRNANPCETSEMGSACAQAVRRAGEQQRNTYSILQNLLSGPAYPVSAAERSVTVNGVKGWKGIVLLSLYCGSSIHVKAEVTLQTGGCTNDALSGKLEESLCICSDRCSLTGLEFEGLISRNCGFIFAFSLGILDSTQLNSIHPLYLSNILDFCMMVASNNEIDEVWVEAMIFACVGIACHLLSTFLLLFSHRTFFDIVPILHLFYKINSH